MAFRRFAHAWQQQPKTNTAKLFEVQKKRKRKKHLAQVYASNIQRASISLLFTLVDRKSHDFCRNLHQSLANGSSWKTVRHFLFASIAQWSKERRKIENEERKPVARWFSASWVFSKEKKPREDNNRASLLVQNNAWMHRTVNWSLNTQMCCTWPARAPAFYSSRE